MPLNEVDGTFPPLNDLEFVSMICLGQWNVSGQDTRRDVVWVVYIIGFSCCTVDICQVKSTAWITAEASKRLWRDLNIIHSWPTDMWVRNKCLNCKPLVFEGVMQLYSNRNPIPYGNYFLFMRNMAKIERSLYSSYFKKVFNKKSTHFVSNLHNYRNLSLFWKTKSELLSKTKNYIHLVSFYF